jgi:hypothetical protein
MNRKIVNFVLAACLIFSFASAASAKGSKGKGAKKDKTHTIDGTVFKATKESLVIQVAGDNPKRVTVSLTQDTVISGDLVAGAKVTVTVATGNRATKVDVSAAP